MNGVPSVEVWAAAEIFSQSARWEERQELNNRVTTLEKVDRGQGEA